jgi:hypothetical protein
VGGEARLGRCSCVEGASELFFFFRSREQVNLMVIRSWIEI